MVGLLIPQLVTTGQQNNSQVVTFGIEFTGPEEVMIDDGQWGLQWLPDGPVSYPKKRLHYTRVESLIPFLSH
jgi:hypothetical protein